MGLTGDNDLLAAKTAQNTTLSAVGGGLMSLCYHVIWLNEEGFGAVMGRMLSSGAVMGRALSSKKKTL